MTLACVACGLCSLVRALLYIAAQMVGATAASALLALLEPIGNGSMVTIGTFGCNKPLSNERYQVTDWQAITIEAVLTGILLFVVFASVIGKPANTASISAHITIGFTVVTCMFAGVPLCLPSLDQVFYMYSYSVITCWIRAKYSTSTPHCTVYTSVVHNGARGPKWALWGFSLGSFKIIFS